MFHPRTIFAILPLLSSVISSPIHDKRQDEGTVYPAIRFTNDFPEVVYTGQTIDLSWEGGDGYYALYSIYFTQGQGSVRPGYYSHNMSETSLSVTLRDTVSPNTTLNFGIAEANADVNVEFGQSYQLSGAIPFIQA
ncbi:hypothetical protein I302_104510 [Kwoniella bestiolae CBS 10118]|uniref:Uncharacterized protein n=1 Tax=Kwoniella bestiolae CBS 10118 TaxID=1296100 RepID=A0A1B9GBH6_9TREE|nr:hypothetical protein I302_03216 [Kwoniella bestiolae CBS 10118]OCF28357.1 hypothetical protein I302_03216 [Kwoniella bestiolae CBS 10118]